jgi:hypothetical protein
MAHALKHFTKQITRPLAGRRWRDRDISRFWSLGSEFLVRSHKTDRGLRTKDELKDQGRTQDQERTQDQARRTKD